MRKIQHAFLAAFILVAGSAFGADAIAFISNLKGEVAVDGNARPALLSELSRGQRIVLGKDAHASVMYIATGKEYVLKGPAEYLVKETEIVGSAGMPPLTRETEWRTTNKVLVQVAQSSAASIRMRSAAQPKAVVEPKLLFPTQGTIATLQPTLRWRGEAKDHAELALMVAGQDKPVHLAKARGDNYRVPVKLAPETDYLWVLTRGGSEVGTGRFRTLSAEALAQVERRRPSDKAQFSDRLLFTLMLHEMGAVQEARESWARLAQERADLPELSALAK